MSGVSHEEPTNHAAGGGVDLASVRMSWAAAALVAAALIVVIARPFAGWPLVSLALEATGMTAALVARRRAIRRRRTQGLVPGMVAFIVGLILVVYSLPWTVVELLIATS